MSKELVRGKYLVYKLIDAGEVVYIGQSTKLDLRVTAHRKDKSFDEVLYTEVSSHEEMNALEHYLILEYAPKYNDDVKLNKARDYISKFNKTCETIVWECWIGKNPVDVMEAINTFSLLRYVEEERQPEPIPMQVNLNWYFEDDVAIRTTNDERNGEPFLVLNKAYAENLFISSLSNLRTLSDEDLKTFVFESFIDINHKKDKVEAMLCMNKLREISKLYQDFNRVL